MGSLLGNWARQFVNREVRFPLLSHPLLLRCAARSLPLSSTPQDILFGLFWLIWAECALLSHVFRYDSVSAMPLVARLYLVLTPVLIISACLTYSYPLQIKKLFTGQHSPSSE